VPTDGPIEVEAQVQNKDIGFILPDQEAVVKIDARRAAAPCRRSAPSAPCARA
jgi:hypothetical protein